MNSKILFIPPLIFLVTVKWNGTKYPVDIDINSAGIQLKQTLAQLTGVEPARQKIMVKGGILKVIHYIININVD